MRYNTDLSSLGPQEYKELLKRQNLLPGRRVLLQNIDQNFEHFENEGICNVAELKKRLSTTLKLAAFAQATGVSKEYLTILKREIGSLEQKPIPLADFPDVDETLISRLNDQGIRNSKDHFESRHHGVDELSCLCDLVRINGVGAVAATTFYEAGYRSVDDVASADAAAMLESVSKVNDSKHYYKAKLGVKDMQFCIDFASLLIKYCK